MPRLADQATPATPGQAGRAEAHRRWLVLQPYLEDGVPLTHVAAQCGIPLRTPAKETSAGGMILSDRWPSVGPPF